MSKGFYVLVPAEAGWAHYEELTGFTRPKSETGVKRIKHSKIRRYGKFEGLWELGVKDNGLTRKYKSEIIDFCKSNNIPYEIEEYEYCNGWI